jgi:hypothetical protein
VVSAAACGRALAVAVAAEAWRRGTEKGRASVLWKRENENEKCCSRAGRSGTIGGEQLDQISAQISFLPVSGIPVGRQFVRIAQTCNIVTPRSKDIFM